MTFEEVAEYVDQMGVTHQISHFFPYIWLDFLNRAKIFLKYASNAQKILTENGRASTIFGLSAYRRAGNLCSCHRVLFYWMYYGTGLSAWQPEGRPSSKKRAEDVFCFASSHAQFSTARLSNLHRVAARVAIPTKMKMDVPQW